MWWQNSGSCLKELWLDNLPIKILFWDPISYSCHTQKHIPFKHREGLKPTIQHILDKAILKFTHSHYTIPLLPVLKPGDFYCLVHDVRIINSSVIHIYTPISNHCSLHSDSSF